MAKKPRIKAHIKEAGSALKEVMMLGLAPMIDAAIDQIIKKAEKLPESQRFNATKDIKLKGISAYRADLQKALAIIATESLKQARDEVPSKAKMKFGEWEKLPKSVKARVYRQLQLILMAQSADIEKILFFQYGHSIDSTDSMDTIRKDLVEAGEDYLTGASITSGSQTIAAQVVNETRQAYFTDEETSKEIEAYEFVNEDPVSPICTELAGSIFGKDDPDLGRYQTPLHWNCKSWIRPILNGNLGNREITGASPSKEAKKSIQFSECDHGE